MGGFNKPTRSNPRPSRFVKTVPLPPEPKEGIGFHKATREPAPKPKRGLHGQQ